MTREQVSLARRRLGLGITNVGFWVVAAVLGLLWLDWGRRVPSDLDPVWIGVGCVAVQALFDVVGGWWLMPAPRPSGMDFFRGWLRGVGVHTAMLAVAGSFAWLSLRWTGGFCAGVAVASVFLGLARGVVHRALHGGRVRIRLLESGQVVLAAEVGDPAFTGGVIGFGRGAGILIPERWRDGLPRAELDLEIFRRRWEIERGLPLRAFLLLLMWNVLGVWIGEITTHWSSLPAAFALLALACWMTLWTFLSLLVLPFLGQGTVHAADRAAADSGMDPSEWIRLFPKLTGEDGNSKAPLQNIFYPIPSAELRLRSLKESRRGLVLGPVARGNLYYSLAGLTLLGRSVHCNVGRPGLWVFPPMT